jgi:hypothetical protein
MNKEQLGATYALYVKAIFKGTSSKEMVRIVDVESVPADFMTSRSSGCMFTDFGIQLGLSMCLFILAIAGCWIAPGRRAHASKAKNKTL